MEEKLSPRLARFIIASSIGVAIFLVLSLFIHPTSPFVLFTFVSLSPMLALRLIYLRCTTCYKTSTSPQWSKNGTMYCQK